LVIGAATSFAAGKGLAQGMERTTADYMEMLGHSVNALADAIRAEEKLGIHHAVISALP